MPPSSQKFYNTRNSNILEYQGNPMLESEKGNDKCCFCIEGQKHAPGERKR